MVEQTAQRVGHEPRDVNVHAVMWFAVGLVVCGIIIYLALVGLYTLFSHQHPSPEPASRIELQPRMLAPEPRLQTNPTADREQFRASEEQKLNSYGWIDKQHGVIRIPIQRAIDLIAERGLPTRGPGTQNSSGKTPEQMRQEKAAATAPQKVRGEP